VTIALLNLAGLAIEIVGVIILVSIDRVERNVLEAQTRLEKAHMAYLHNSDNELTQHYLARRNNPNDRQVVDSYDPRDNSHNFRLALKCLGFGMFLQFVAALVPVISGNA
jgi:hypothetical protein